MTKVAFNYSFMVDRINFFYVCGPKKSKYMKKIITLVSAVCLALIISCGPSAEEKAKMEQQRQDSINAVVEQQRQDSIAFAERAMQDSIAAVQKAAADSLRSKAIADSLANLKSKPKTKIHTQKVDKAPETPKVGHKKPGAK